MPDFHQHHCAVCGKIGNQRCLNVGHYVECQIHLGSYHSVYAVCVKCVRAAEREARQDYRDRASDTSDPIAAGKRPKKLKRGKMPATTKSKTMKQIRKDLKAAKQSGGSDTSVSSIDDDEAFD